MFTENDKTQLLGRNIPENQIENQLNRLKKGTLFAHLVRPATLENGICRVDETQILDCIDTFENDKEYYHLTKFVPASGAATRMFKSLYTYLEQPCEQTFPTEFFQKIHDFAFFSDLDQAVVKGYGLDTDAMMKASRHTEIVETLLQDKGLSYGKLPKALLKFHHYGTFDRLALEEHLVEAAQYACNADGIAHLHFTVSAEHETAFEQAIKMLKPAYEKQYGIKYDITLSYQKPSTDTVAIDSEGNLFRNADGSILFRPGGHGALIENLNDLQEEIVFIKNIDNVTCEQQSEKTCSYKKALAGRLMQLQQQTFEYLEMLDEGFVDDNELDEMMQFAQDELTIDIPDFVKAYNNIEKIDFLYDRFNRPMRVCGMVRNDGEPGGGPFWIKNIDDEVSLQIVESAQINHSDEKQEAIFKAATHFNPVDLVCACWNYKGEAFNLKDYVDASACFISSKSKDGRELKALELPGLWNGAMADWITVFVEVPAETFNPVKTVNDLLKTAHQ